MPEPVPLSEVKRRLTEEAGRRTLPREAIGCTRIRSFACIRLPRITGLARSLLAMTGSTRPARTPDTTNGRPAARSASTSPRRPRGLRGRGGSGCSPATSTWGSAAKASGSETSAADNCTISPFVARSWTGATWRRRSQRRTSCRSMSLRARAWFRSTTCPRPPVRLARTRCSGQARRRPTRASGSSTTVSSRIAFAGSAPATRGSTTAATFSRSIRSGR